MGNDEQMELWPPTQRLRRVDGARNMRRYYLLAIQPDLFGGSDVVREWGRIGRAGRTRIDHHADEGAAVSSLRVILQAKLRRGYRRP